MKIEISDKLYQYLKTEDIKALTLDFEQTKTCCGQPDLPTVKKGQPPYLENYIRLETRDVVVYVNQSLKVPEKQIRLDLYAFLFAKEITIEGVQKC